MSDYSPLAAISRRVANVSYAAGCSDVLCGDTAGFGVAVAAAAAADVALVFVGLDHTVEVRSELGVPSGTKMGMLTLSHASANASASAAATG